MEPQFPSNSQNPIGNKTPKKEIDPPKKDIQKVVTVAGIQQRKTLGRRFKAIFSGGDAKGAARYIVTDVLVPSLKNMISDAGKGFIDRMMYGESPKRRYDSVGRSRYSYNQPVSVVDRFARRPGGMLPDQPPLGQSRSRRQTVAEILLFSKEEAEAVIEGLNDIIEKYEVASVADLHELVDMPSAYIDNKWGWTSLAYANIRQVREGFLLDLPPAESI